MNVIQKFFHKTFIRTQIIQELFRTLWKHKLWWIMPLVFLLLIILIILFIAGSTGIAAFVYPLF